LPFSINPQARNRRTGRFLSTPWLLGAGLLLGLLLGAGGFLLLEHPGWIGLWLALFLGLGWAGWDVRLRQVGELPSETRSRAIRARPVKDGPFDMVELAGGSFLMGSAEGDTWADQNDWSRVNERPQHWVRVDGFRIGRTCVTLKQWQVVMGYVRWIGGQDDLPHSGVSWYEALLFCNELSRREGYMPCYRQQGVWPFRDWFCDWSADGYRLPTEAEWEYACRAGTNSPWSHGDDLENLGDFAWYSGNSWLSPHPVAQKLPNPWGLYDMHGNIWEWCWDRYGPYRKRAVENPRETSRVGYWGFLRVKPFEFLQSLSLTKPRRILRGGSFGISPELLRSAVRIGIQPEVRVRDHGFRCVRVPARQH
jgi:formylglycine-generating enzyme required for sulfatase activity